MRIDIIDNIMDAPSFGLSESKPRDELESSVYLPLPIGLLRENHVLEYEPTEFGVTAEIVRQNYDAVRGALTGLVNSGEIDIDIGDIGSSVAGTVGKTFKTLTDQLITDASRMYIPTMLQANGLARRTNYALLFRGIDQVRDFTLEWTLFPKNYDDAKSIETIIKVIQSAAMPEIKNKAFLDSIVDTVSNAVSEKNELSDVKSKNPEEPTGLFSTTFLIPKKIKLKIFERFNNDNIGNIEETDIREITHLINFPHEMVMSNIIIEHAEGENTLPPFIKYENNGDVEYFHSVYKLRITMSDMQVTTRDHINLEY